MIADKSAAFLPFAALSLTISCFVNIQSIKSDARPPMMLAGNAIGWREGEVMIKHPANSSRQLNPAATDADAPRAG